MGFGGFFKGLAKGVGSAVGRPLRGIGRVMRGNFREGFGDIAHGIKRGAQAAALLGSGGMAAPLIAGGSGMLERGMEEDASFGNVMGAGVSGRADAQMQEDQQQYYLDTLALRREEDEYNRSQEKMLRDMILSGAWRS